MMRHEPVVEVPQDIAVAAPERRRERVVVRRRRSKRRHRQPGPGAGSRRGTGRIVLVCAGVMLLMALGVYLSLSRRDTDHVRRAAPAAAAAVPVAEP